MPQVERAWTLALAVAFVALAGCSEEPPQAQAGAIELAEVDNTATRGSISGVVVDEAIRPLPGVGLTLLADQRATATDDGGLFVFEGLEPGLYTVSVSPHTAEDGRLFLGIQSTAEVVAGETAKVRMVLPADPTPQPYHALHKFDAYDEVTLGVVDGGYEIVRQAFLNDTGVPPLCDVCTFYFRSDGTVDTFLLEAVWQDSIADPTGDATAYFYDLSDLDSLEYEADYCTSPCYAPISGGVFGNATNFGLSMYPDENWVAYQQTWQVFLTLWYLAPPPEGWSFVNGDA